MKKVFVLIYVLLAVIFFASLASANSANNRVILPTSSSYVFVKAVEWFKINLITYKTTSKAKLYNSYSDQRISEMEYALSINDSDSFSASLNRYEVQKSKALELAQKTLDTGIMEKIRERTLEQQRIMTKLQIQLDSSQDLQRNIVQVQKDVANQIKNTVKVVEGDEEAENINKKTWIIWRDPDADISGNLPELPDKLIYSPGTGPGETGGRVYQGGTKHIWSTGTGGSAPAGVDKNEQIISPGTSNGQSEGGKTIIDPGTAND